jgi:hypothetical protein
MTRDGKYREYRDHPYVSSRINFIDLPRVGPSGMIDHIDPLVGSTLSGSTTISGSSLISDPILPITVSGEVYAPVELPN